MKKNLIPVILLLGGLAVLLPFASSNPDALEVVTSTFGVQEEHGPWQGLMPDYAVAAIENSYLSTLIAGITGTILVLSATYLIAKTMTIKNPNNTQ